MFKGFRVTKILTDDAKFMHLRAQFHHALFDNLQQRFPETPFLEAAQVLDKTAWPSSPVELALYNDREIAYLPKQLRVRVSFSPMNLQQTSLRNSLHMWVAVC